MATVLRSFDWARTGRQQDSRTVAYPWEDWLDGRIWRLDPGKDFTCQPKSLESVIRTTANRRGVRVHIRVQPTGHVVLQRHAATSMKRSVTHSPSKAEVQQRQQKALNEALAESRALREARMNPPTEPIANSNGHEVPEVVKRVRKIKRRAITNRPVTV